MYIFDWKLEKNICFSEKYDYVGKLLKPGENHSNYSDDEEEETPPTPTAAGDKSKDD